ncbi:MAG: transcriptional regulator with XRE-family HTH domain [Marinobacter maritimus]|jgi:transcriptional regulator with XRE-family HTH domain
MGMNALEKLKARIRSSESYWFESAKLEFVKVLNQRVRRLGLKNKDLSEKIETSPAYISKVMRGDENLTIETMVKLVRATGGNLHFHISEIDERISWFGVARDLSKPVQRARHAAFRSAAKEQDHEVQLLEMNGKREGAYAA